MQKNHAFYIMGFARGSTMLTIIKEISAILIEKHWTLSTAESCTGGLISAAITDMAGSSAFFKGSIVSYDNSVKTSVLHVPDSVLISYGAVSNQTVEAMVRGVCDLLKTECALSVSGIAGPGGATPGKEVGLVYIGLKINNLVTSYKCQFYGTRDQIRKTTVKTALLHLLNNLK